MSKFLRFFTQGKNVLGEFKLDGEKGSGKHGKRLVLCSLEELNVYLDANGKKRNRSESQKEQFLRRRYSEKLEKILTEKKTKIEEGKLLTNLFDDYIMEKEPFLDFKSIREYRNSGKHFFNAVGTRVKTENIKKQEIESKFLAYLSEVGITRTDKYFSHINYFFNWVRNKGYPKIPRLTVPTFTQKLPRVLTKSEVEKIAQNLSGRRNSLNLTRAFRLLLYSGLRVSEIINLRLVDIDIEGKNINIVDNRSEGHHVKGYHEEVVPIHSDLLSFICEDFGNRKPVEIYWLDDGEGNPAYSRGDKLARPFSKIMRNIGIIAPPIHVFRYTLATRLTEAKVPVQMIQKILRHKDIDTTLRYINTSSVNTRPLIESIKY